MLTLFLLACVDNGVKVFNTPPEVNLTDPVDGQVIKSNTPITFTATVEDSPTPTDALTLIWTSGTTGALEGTQVITENVVTFITNGFAAGEQTISLTAIDASGESGSDDVTLLIEDNEAPVVIFASPAEGAVLALNWPITVSIQVSDDDDAPETLTLEWGGAVAGNPDVPLAPTADGSAAFDLSGLSAGSYTLSVTATDPHGDAATTEITFSLVEGDLDSDGHVDVALGGDDCNDGNGGIYPGAGERCDGIDTDCDGLIDEDADDAQTWFDDSDGDGYGDPATATLYCDDPAEGTTDGSDCDDADAAIHPAATEVCDGADNDCDGSADGADAVDVLVWYTDSDGDGYGDPTTARTACEAAATEVADATDCDDTTALSWPGNPELCDGLDNNCDGVVDESSALDAGTWYTDADADTYGDPASAVAACAAPAGYLSDGSDCDDADAAIHPAATEVCDGADNNCDGDTDGADATGALTWYTDADADGYGDLDAPVYACTQPTGTVTDTLDCLDSDATVNPAGTEVCNDGVDNNCDGNENGCGIRGIRDLEEAAALLYGTSNNDNAGDAVAGVGDANGDGRADLLIGAAAVDGVGTGSGAAYLVLGMPAASLDLAASVAIFQGRTAADALGSAVAGAGDIDADGYADLLIGAPGEDAGGVDAGGAWLLSGAQSGTLTFGDAGVGFEGEAAGDAAGSALAGAGDQDGDGYDAVLIGAPGEDSAGADAGAVYLLDGPLYGTLDLATADIRLTGEAAGDDAGSAVSGAGDVDGDGYTDAVVGAPGQDAAGTNAGAIYLLSRPVSGSLADVARWDGEAAGDEAGLAVAGALRIGEGDINGDGYDDLVVGAPYANGVGRVYVLTQSGASLADAEAILEGEASGDLAGWAVSLGDLDGDALADVALSAPEADNGERDGGAVYTVYGPSSGSINLAAAAGRMEGRDMHLYAGRSLAFAHDVDADGYGDLLVGGPEDDRNGASAGVVWLLLGGGY